MKLSLFLLFMCGIAGVYSFNQSALGFKDNLIRASDCLRHRGPDAGNIFFSDNVGLAHRRLTIIDLSESANQPMHDETGRYTIIFNGEIFNFKSLREKL